MTVHGVNNLLVKDNVAFNNMGHAFFLEDGVEEDNVFDGNLAIFTQTSSSLLNVDVTPGKTFLSTLFESVYGLVDALKKIKSSLLSDIIKMVVENGILCKSYWTFYTASLLEIEL